MPSVLRCGGRGGWLERQTGEPGAGYARSQSDSATSAEAHERATAGTNAPGTATLDPRRATCGADCRTASQYGADRGICSRAHQRRCTPVGERTPCEYLPFAANTSSCGCQEWRYTYARRLAPRRVARCWSPSACADHGGDRCKSPAPSRRHFGLSRRAGRVALRRARAHTAAAPAAELSPASTSGLLVPICHRTCPGRPPGM